MLPPRIPRRWALLLALLLSLSSSLAAPAPAQAAQASALASRYGLAGVRNGARAWSADELTLLDRSLAALQPRERALLEGVAFVRGAGGRNPRESGLFTWDRRGRRITIFSRAFRDGGRSKSGLNWTILHEVGHALAARPLLDARDKESEALARYNKGVTDYNEAVAAYNRAARASNQSQSAGDKARTEKARARVDAQGERLGPLKIEALKARRGVKRAARQLKSRQPTAGALGAYRRVLAGSRAPTRYGRTHIAESFAESFAMFHCDPAGLKRSLPKVHAWFARGGHLER